ncbi:MAG: hypothetical protein PUH24_03525 [Prevotellaceae bacterium]|nr:hypothetical protein [Prevotella sp.]MDD7257335.1 hypothetical protein [Prevotellaceae bacterium]MDY6131070.1 hypothetical protein [Prevotella sp.]
MIKMYGTYTRRHLLTIFIAAASIPCMNYDAESFTGKMLPRTTGYTTDLPTTGCSRCNPSVGTKRMCKLAIRVDKTNYYCHEWK